MSKFGKATRDGQNLHLVPPPSEPQPSSGIVGIELKTGTLMKLNDDGTVSPASVVAPSPVGRVLPRKRVSDPPLWLVAVIVMALTLFVLLATGCTGTPRADGPPPPPTGCYAAALARADARASLQCGGVWSACERRAAILDQLDSELESCDLNNNEGNN